MRGRGFDAEGSATPCGHAGAMAPAAKASHVASTLNDRARMMRPRINVLAAQCPCG
jgi:hypothetical protein